jgi:hypothetical protein
VGSKGNAGEQFPGSFTGRPWQGFSQCSQRCELHSLCGCPGVGAGHCVGRCSLKLPAQLHLIDARVLHESMHTARVVSQSRPWAPHCTDSIMRQVTMLQSKAPAAYCNLRSEAEIAESGQVRYLEQLGVQRVLLVIHMCLEHGLQLGDLSGTPHSVSPKSTQQPARVNWKSTQQPASQRAACMRVEHAGESAHSQSSLGSALLDQRYHRDHRAEAEWRLGR